MASKSEGWAALGAIPPSPRSSPTCCPLSRILTAASSGGATSLHLYRWPSVLSTRIKGGCPSRLGVDVREGLRPVRAFIGAGSPDFRFPGFDRPWATNLLLCYNEPKASVVCLGIKLWHGLDCWGLMFSSVWRWKIARNSWSSRAASWTIVGSFREGSGGLLSVDVGKNASQLISTMIFRGWGFMFSGIMVPLNNMGRLTVKGL